jgi:MFS family permease
MMARTMPAATDSTRSSMLIRVFGLEPHEYAAAAWSFLYFFCVLSAYYILRPVREAMGVESGPATLPYLFMASFAVMLLATPIFGWITSRYPRKIFLPWVYAFFIFNIVIFWAIFSQRIDDGQSHIWLGRIFFVWLSVFNLYVVSVFWSFMADIYTREQGRRLFGLLSSGGSTGALLGGTATSTWVVDINFHNLLPISAGDLRNGLPMKARNNPATPLKWTSRSEEVHWRGPHTPIDQITFAPSSSRRSSPACWERLCICFGPNWSPHRFLT